MRINYNYWKLGAFIRVSWKTGLNTQIAELSHGFFPDPAQSFTLGANHARPVVKFPPATRLISLFALALRAHVICTFILWPGESASDGPVCVPRPEAVVTAAVHGGMKHHFPLCHQKRRQLRLIQYLSPQTSLRHQKNLL
ncbi:MAG: hypothetical protein DME86_04345 [Verrucomicrobia bacterium]|nr:MAG: hypothetical protein DME86_04345 [Verrucomicrobiota bacterium]